MTQKPRKTTDIISALRELADEYHTDCGAMNDLLVEAANRMEDIITASQDIRARMDLAIEFIDDGNYEQARSILI